MTRFTSSFTPRTTLLLAALSLGGVACGGTGSDDDEAAGAGGMATGSGGMSSGGSGGMATAMIQYGFDIDNPPDLPMWETQYVSCGKDNAGVEVPCIEKTDAPSHWVTGKGDVDMGGAMQVDAAVTGPRQYVGTGVQLAGADFTDKIVTARVMLESGLMTDTELQSFSVGAKIYMKTGTDYVYAAGAYTTIKTHGTWFNLRFDPKALSYVDTADGKMFDITTVGELGIQLDTADSLTSTATAAVWLVDNVRW
jgi:hypothetical protein